MAMPTPSSDRVLLSSAAAYARWAATYDTDGNPLQALDSVTLRELLPQFFRQSIAAASANTRPLFVDLGCGTGRNTLALLNYAYGSAGKRAEVGSAFDVVGLDESAEMLERAEAKVANFLASQTTDQSARPNASFHRFDMLAKHDSPASCGEANTFRPPWGTAAGVVSTLVAEHIQDLALYFGMCARLLQGGGLLLATNMHPDMGNVTGAGFEEANGGAKVRVSGYVHTVQGFDTAARAAGFVPVHQGEAHVLEKAVEEWMMEQDVEGLGKRGKKWLGKKIWMGGLWKKAGPS